MSGRKRCDLAIGLRNTVRRWFHARRIRERVGDAYLRADPSLSRTAIRLRAQLPIDRPSQMKMRSQRSVTESSGATLVEFALTAPLFFALLFGAIQAGLALWTQFGLEYGSDAAARCASVNASTCGTADQISGYAASHALGLSLPSSVFSAATSG